MYELDYLEIPDLNENQNESENSELTKLTESIFKSGLGDIILDNLRRGENTKLPLIKDRASIQDLKFTIKFTLNESLPHIENVSLIVHYPGIMESGQGRLGQKPFQLGTIESGVFIFNEYFSKPGDPGFSDVQKKILKDYIDSSHQKEIFDRVQRYKDKFSNILSGIKELEVSEQEELPDIENQYSA